MHKVSFRSIFDKQHWKRLKFIKNQFPKFILMSHCTLNLRFHKLQISTNAVIINKTDSCFYPGEVYASGNIIKVFCKVFFSYTFSTISDAVHKPEPKKWVSGFLVTSGCLRSRKVLWAVRIGRFWPKIEVIYIPE